MKKIFLIAMLLFVCLFHFNVKADDDVVEEIIPQEESTLVEKDNNDEQEKQQEEIKQEEKVEVKEEKKEEIPTRATKAANYSLTIEFINTALGEGRYETVGTNSFERQNRKTFYTWQLLNLSSRSAKTYTVKNCDNDGRDCQFTFDGWYTEDGTKITNVPNADHTTAYNSNDSYLISTFSNTAISISVGYLSDNINIKLYAKWTKEYLVPVDKEVTIKLIDKRTGNSVGNKAVVNNTTLETWYTYSGLGLSDSSSSYIDEKDGSRYTGYRHNFLGWYTQSDEKITADGYATSLETGINVKLKNTTSPTTLYVNVDNISDDKEITLYAKWETIKLTTELTVNFYNENNLVLTRVNEKNNFFDNNINPISTYSKLNLSSEAVDYYDVKNGNMITRHKFLGWYTEDDTLVDYSGVNINGAVVRRTYETENPSSIYTDVENLEKDSTINLYAKWETEEIEIPNDKYKVTIELYDTREDADGIKVASKVVSNGTNVLPYNTYSYIGLASVGEDSIRDGDYKFIFDGWYTEDGQKISSENSTTLLDGNLSLKKRYESSIDVMLSNVKIDDDYDPANNPTVKLYAKWVRRKASVTVTVHVHDDKHDLHKVEILYKGNGGEFDEVSGGTGNSLPATYKQILNSTGTIKLDLNKIFTGAIQNAMIGKDDYGTIDRDTLIVHKQSGVAVKYTFKNWLDKDGNVIGSDGYKVPESDSKVIENYEVVNLRGDSVIKKELVITIKGLSDMDIDDDTDNVDIYIYTEWDEYTTAVLTSEYIDKISTGSGSAANPSGGVVEYKHTFSNPEDKTPQPHHNFLYWQFEEPSHEDDQIDTTREYKDQDVFEYDLFYKPDMWRGTVRAYAHWESDVTLNLYDDNKKLLSTQTSFDSVSINVNPEKYGYTFLGWFDKDGNKVTETTFYPEDDGIEPQPVEITLYAKFEKITRDITVTKVWDDSDNVEGLRPKNITIVLLADGEEVDSVELSGEGNEWTYTFEGLDKYNDKDEIKYTVKEVEIDNYETEIDGFTITNSREVEYTSVTITKVWADDDNESGKRPESITIALVVSDEEIETVELSDANEWTYTFTELPVYVNGEVISYSVRELEVPEGYEVAYEETDDGYIIHNVLGQGEGEPDEPNDNPQTGDNIYLYIMALFASLNGFVICLKRYN